MPHYEHKLNIGEELAISSWERLTNIPKERLQAYKKNYYMREHPVKGDTNSWTPVILNDANQEKAGYNSRKISKVAQSQYASVQHCSYTSSLWLLDFPEPLTIVTDFQ